MTSKRRRSAPVLPDWINHLKKEGLGSKYEAAMREWAEAQSPGMGRDEPDWDDPSTREVAADSALTLRKESSLYRPVAAVFESAGLNLKNPFHWRILFDFFCWAHFRPKGKPGRPGKWSQQYSQLARDFALVRKEKLAFSNLEVCRVLKKRFPNRYGRPNEPPSAERIAKEAKKSQDPKFNPALGATLDAVLRLVRLDFEKQGLEWNADTEARKSKEWVEFLNKQVQRSGLHPVPKMPS
jgi:hypothetical protein